MRKAGGGEEERELSEFASEEESSEEEEQDRDGATACWEKVWCDPGLKGSQTGYACPSDAESLENILISL